MINQSQDNETQPWYIRKKDAHINYNILTVTDEHNADFNTKFVLLKRVIANYFPSLLASIFTLCAGFCLSILFQKELPRSFFSLAIICALFLFILSIFFALYQIGITCQQLTKKYKNSSPFSLGVRFIQGYIKIDEPRQGIPAPEMALYQFVQQVRAYSVEKSFQKNKPEVKGNNYYSLSGIDPAAILKRRWNDVLDSLNEFEIYLANDPKGIIEKLIIKSPTQVMDVSQIFRDVAETFDTTWRRKGINIEQAIVTPLKANTNEALLRRLLVGPWRSCVYFARKGNGVIFSAKSVQGKIIARWECEGLVFPQDFFLVVHNELLSVNDRIERCIDIVTTDPNSPNTLFALVSFVTWLDLAKAAGSDYSVNQGNEGLEIELRL